MPTYDYECLKCKRIIEKFQFIHDKPLARCSHCGGRLRRLLGTGAGFIFKGSGFYQTDYRSESYKKREKEEKKSVSEVSAAKESAGGKPSAGTKAKTDVQKS